jgi:4-oxalocrotonate tautomerase
MPFIEIKVIEGAYTHEEKRQMVQQVSEAVIAVEGEPLLPFTHTVITETPSGEWAIGGQSLTAEDVRAKRAAPTHA